MCAQALNTMLSFKFPDVGEGVHEGVIIRWLVKEGESVKEDQILLEMETAKAIVEIPSPRSGFILKRYGDEGDIINVGNVLVDIGEKGETATEKPVGRGVVGDLPEAPEEDGTVSTKTSPAKSKQTASAEHAAQKALPAARQLAIKLGVDLNKLIPTGTGGYITVDDVINAGGKNAAAYTSVKKHKNYEAWGPIERIPLVGIRKTIAEHMAHSASTIPHVTHFDTCDVTKLVELRKKQKPEMEKQGIKLTYLPYVIKAAIHGLREFPIINANLDDETGTIIVKKYFNIGIAVDTEEGLIVPVIKNADKKSILELAKEIDALANKARERKIDLADLQGGSFTITSVGSLGGEFFTPIINTDQGAILAVASIKEKPAIKDGQIAIRHILHIGVSFDHRIIDGATAARFLNTVMQNLASSI